MNKKELKTQNERNQKFNLLLKSILRVVLLHFSSMPLFFGVCAWVYIFILNLMWLAMILPEFVRNTLQENLKQNVKIYSRKQFWSEIVYTVCQNDLIFCYLIFSDALFIWRHFSMVTLALFYAVDFYVTWSKSPNKIGVFKPMM